MRCRRGGSPESKVMQNQDVAGKGREHFAVSLYHPVKPRRGEGKEMVPERPPLCVCDVTSSITQQVIQQILA